MPHILPIGGSRTKNMTNKKAYEQAQKELLEEKVEEVKDYIKTTLKEIESKKKEKSVVEEELRILKMDLEDLRKGKFDKLLERKRKSKRARGVGVNPGGDFMSDFGAITSVCNAVTLPSSDLSNGTNPDMWTTMTAGTYETETKTYYLN